MGQVITNKNTTQSPLTTAGLTGAQSEFFVPASRIYVKTSDVTPAAPTTKSAGTTPAGWTDLGMMEATAKVTYTKTTVKLKSGIDKVLRQEYTTEITGAFEVQLIQFDDEVLQAITGLTPYTVQSGSIVRFNIGSEALVQKAAMLVNQNKVDGKEHQYYTPNCFLNFSIEEVNGYQVLKVMFDLPMFNMDAVDQVFSQTIFA